MNYINNFEITKVQKKLFIRYILPLFLVASIVLIRLVTKNTFDQNTYTLLILPVIIQACLDGLKSGIFTLVLSLLTANALYVEPYNTLKLINTSNPFTTLVYVVQTLILIFIINYILDTKKSLKISTEELKESSKRLRKVIDAISNIVIITDYNYCILETNKTYTKKFKRSWDLIIGKHISEIPPFKDNALLLTEINKLTKKFEDNPNIVFESQIEINKSKVFVEVTIAKIEYKDKVVNNVFSLRDITSEKTQEKEKDDFISMISHELKTPMTIIKGYLQILHEQNKDDNILGILDVEMDKLNDLIEELYDMTKIQANKFKIEAEQIDLVDLAKQSIKGVEPILDGHKIKLNSENTVIVNADPRRISQVIENLLTNSIKYSNPNSEIIVNIKKVGKKAKVEVIDKSKGISQEELLHIFDRYYQVDSDADIKNSLGLGLFISKKIIEQHKGKIHASSTTNVGSTFSFELPI